MKATPRLLLLLLTACGAAATARAAELVEVTPVCDRVVVLHVFDGEVVHETAAGGGADGRVTPPTLDAEAASSPGSYQIESPDDPRYHAPLSPLRVGRKSKGRDFVRDGPRVEWAAEHWLYLVLPHPMREGLLYNITLRGLAITPASVALRFDTRHMRSDSVHVNQIGYVPAAPQKFAYVSAWMGDLGGLPLDDYGGATFRLIEVGSGAEVFRGRLALRKRLTDGPDDGQPDVAPHGSHAGADVWEADFSSFRRPGEYVLAVERVGCSYPFRVGADVYRRAYVAAARALYHQRCGVELKEPYTEWTRPVCHLPSTRPFMQTTHRYMDGPYHDGSAEAEQEMTGEARRVVGGWHDAGDWDRESWHMEAADTLLLAYESAPRNFADGELRIPESGNGIPDIVDEAIWNVDYYRRLQRDDGGVSVGFFESSYPRPGEYSVTDSMRWYLYAEDPAASYRYAASAARLSWCLRSAGRAGQSRVYLRSAVRAWEWAERGQRPGDAEKVKDERVLAAACLFKATGARAFEEEFERGCKVVGAESPLEVWGKYDQRWAVWTYVTTDAPGMNRRLKAVLTGAALHYAEETCLKTAARRAGRYGYNWYAPLEWGALTNPQVLPLLVAHRLTGGEKYLATYFTTCDYVLGGNPLNMVWLTGVGRHSPREIFRPDTWYGARGGGVVPGIVPMGPTHFTPGVPRGVWEPRFAQQTTYPEARVWPPAELWFENRHCPQTNEFTVGNIALAAAAYGYLSSAGSAEPSGREARHRGE